MQFYHFGSSGHIGAKDKGSRLEQKSCTTLQWWGGVLKVGQREGAEKQLT